MQILRVKGRECRHWRWKKKQKHSSECLQSCKEDETPGGQSIGGNLKKTRDWGVFIKAMEEVTIIRKKVQHSTITDDQVLDLGRCSGTRHSLVCFSSYVICNIKDGMMYCENEARPPDASGKHIILQIRPSGRLEVSE